MERPPDPHLRSTPTTTASTRRWSAAASSLSRPAPRDRGRVGHRRTGYRHARVFARHRTITELDHARALKAGRSAPVETAVEVRPLARYDALFA
jgi:hypothetical protein